MPHRLLGRGGGGGGGGGGIYNGSHCGFYAQTAFAFSIKDPAEDSCWVQLNAVQFMNSVRPELI